MTSHRIIIAGDGGVGKTTFCNLLQGKEFERRYFPTNGSPWFSLQTTTGLINVIDIAGQEKYAAKKERENIYSNFHGEKQCAIIMFDLTSTLTYKSLEFWHKEILKHCSDIPIVICGNKCEVLPRKIRMENITYARDHNLKYFDMSVKTKYNCDRILQFLQEKMNE